MGINDPFMPAASENSGEAPLIAFDCGERLTAASLASSRPALKSARAVILKKPGFRMNRTLWV
jgi:hypothetical protein